MKRDNRLSGMLHLLLHMAQAREPLTSETLARALNTNPVVIRRTMAGLRERGYVRSEKGHHGGWTLACDLGDITLFDVYEALGRPEVVALGNRQNMPECQVEQAVHSALGSAFEEARALLWRRLREVTLAQLLERIREGSFDDSACL